MAKKGGDKPAPPKKPLTAFFIYKGDIYQQIKKENPDMKMTELTKVISEKWNNVDAATKSKYEKKNEEAKERYEKELKEYIAEHGEPDKKKRGKKKGKGSDSDDSDDDKPKKKAGKKK
mmetsp:Transcript_22284/g.25802  ORF Transcript_22284/g.25802 Transcript_22284/m.25802 type:complete len:118 (-) Transcript_22284:202-555(-)